jgi:predicted dehydrogenase
MTAAPLPLAVAGAGRVSTAVHLPLIALMPEAFTLTAIVETDPVRAARLAREPTGATICSTVDEAVTAGARALLCATPWPTHHEIVLAALSRGLPVLCEKPVTLDPVCLDLIIAAEREHQGQVAVGYMKRHDPAVARFIDVAAEVVDELRQIQVTVVDPNAPHQVEHRMAVPLEPSTSARSVADDTVRRIVGNRYPVVHRAVYAHGLGGSLIHHVNLVHAILAGSGLRLAGRLGYCRQWADGTAVACGWWPSAELGVQMSHVRVPRQRDYVETVLVVADDRRLTLKLPSPYLLDRTATFIDQTADGMRTTHTALPAHNGFSRQLRAWARSVQDPGAPALPGLAEARADLDVVREAADALPLATQDSVRAR